MNVTSFLVDDEGGTDTIVTYVAMSRRWFGLGIHWVSETNVSSGLVQDGRVTFLELMVRVGPWMRQIILKEEQDE